MKKSIILCVAFCLFILSGCATQGADVIICDVDYNTMTLDEAVDRSACAVVGIYTGIDEYQDYVYYTFDVDSVIYGAVSDTSIKMYALRTEVNMEDRYESGEQYVLILEEMEPTIFDDELKYIPPASENMFPVDGPYTMYGAEVSLPDDMDFISYVEYLYDDLHNDLMETEINTLSDDSKAYENTEAELIGEAEFIGYVTIGEMVYESEFYTNTYICTVDELLKGQDLSVKSDGTVFIALAKDAVQSGATYLIGFNPADINSVIYSQATLDSIVLLDDVDSINSIVNTLETN